MVENRHVSEYLEEIVLEGWRRIETGRALRSINNLEIEVQNRIVEYYVQRRTEEITLMTALRLEEDKHKRLERTKVLKMILGKKLGAKKLRRMMLMMEQLTMGDLEMEVEEVEAKVSELMEIGDPRDEDVTDKMELSNHEGVSEEVSLEPVDITTLVNSGGIQGVGEDKYVPFMNVLPDDDYPDGMPDGVKYPEDMPDDICLGNITKTNLIEPWPAHSIHISSRSNKRKRESDIIMGDYEQGRTTNKNRVD